MVSLLRSPGESERAEMDPTPLCSSCPPYSGVDPLIRKEEKICKYLDLPLQHVDDRILKAMNRPVWGEEGRKLLARIREEIPGITLRTSLMVGFPGETEKSFRQALGIRPRRLNLTIWAFFVIPKKKELRRPL